MSDQNIDEHGGVEDAQAPKWLDALLEQEEAESFYFDWWPSSSLQRAVQGLAIPRIVWLKTYSKKDFKYYRKTFKLYSSWKTEVSELVLIFETADWIDTQAGVSLLDRVIRPDERVFYVDGNFNINNVRNCGTEHFQVWCNRSGDIEK